MTIGNYCQITGEKNKWDQVKAEVHGIVVNAPALMNQVYGDPPAPREQVLRMVRFCAVCGAEQPKPVPEHCPSCGSPVTSEVGARDLAAKGESAPLGQRVVAFLIDLVLIAALAALVVWGINHLEKKTLTANPAGMEASAMPSDESLVEPAVEGEIDYSKFFLMAKAVSVTLIFILYHAIFTTAIGATPGKSLMGVRVFLKNGNPKIPMGKAFIRSALYLFTIYLLPIGFLPLLFQEPPAMWLKIVKDDAMFHNLLTDTVVLKVKK